jgi:hypothetical protein
MRSAVALWVSAVLLLSSGCGGRVDGPTEADGGAPGSSSSHTDDDAGADGGAGGGSDDFPVCPADPPSVGAGCASPDQGCSYVTIGGGCTAFRCDGTWKSAPEGC